MPLPVAQYLRMSTERQEYSLDNQADAIRSYAEKRGFVIVKTYEDAGKSGLTAEKRNGLKTLLTDVLSGKADYHAICVYDVSRWGRFQDTDEAAHYEFLCKQSGIPVHYAAEQFGDLETMPSRIMKALKRTMAAEFSRELSERVLAGKKRLAHLGFHEGGPPGYGLRRMMVSSDRECRHELKTGQHKSLTTDRVILVPGTRKEVQRIRWIYKEFLRGKEVADIVRNLNLNKAPWQDGKPWNRYSVRQILTNPKYAGWSRWAMTTQKLRTKTRKNPPEDRVETPNAFKAIVDQETFDRVQRIMKNVTLHKSNETILKELKRFWKRRGRISESMIDHTSSVPSCSTLRNRFGSMVKVYDLMGYRPPRIHAARTRKAQTTLSVRSGIVSNILQLYSNTKIVQRDQKRREVIEFSGLSQLSILLCRWYKPDQDRRMFHWKLFARSPERSLPTLVCLLASTNDKVEAFYLVPSIDFIHRLTLTPGDPWFRRGCRVEKLENLEKTLKDIVTWEPLGLVPRKCSNVMMQLMGPPTRRTHVHDSESSPPTR